MLICGERHLRPCTSSSATQANGRRSSRCPAWLGGEHHFVRDTCPLPCLVRAPGLRRVEPETGHVRGGHVPGEHYGLAISPACPVIPASWRATPPWRCPGSVLRSHPAPRSPPGSPRRARITAAARPCRDVACPACSASCQHDLRSPRSAAAAPWPARQWDASSPGEVSPARRHLPRWRPSHIARDAGHQRIILRLGHTRTVIPGC